MSGFEGGQYHLRVYGPNGYFREFAGNAQEPAVNIRCRYVLGKNGKPTGDVELTTINHSKKAMTVQVTDNAYQQKKIEVKVPIEGTVKTVIPASKSHQWYDFNVHSGASGVVMRFAGRVETGRESVTDPFMAR